LVNQDRGVRCPEEDGIDRFAKASREGVVDLLENHRKRQRGRKFDWDERKAEVSWT
jgi:hypothetical protein